MEKQEIIEKLEYLVSKIKSLNDDDKEIIRQLIESTPELDIKVGGKCPNCWSDAVITLRNHYGISSGKAIVDESSKKWKYLRDYSMVWNGIIIDATTPDEIIDEFVIYHPQFFEKNGN